jgi:hypothetical protein
MTATSSAIPLADPSDGEGFEERSSSSDRIAHQHVATLAAALDAVLIPIAAGEKVPKVKRWSTASDDESVAWWDDADADANVAMRLDRLLMVDADSPELADEFMGWIESEGWPEPVIARTPRGMHFYWRLPEGRTQDSFVLDAEHEGDLRVKSGPGQYALVPPSRTKHGRYEWDVPGRLPSAAPLAPASMPRTLAARKAAMASGGAVESGGSRIPAGMRNTALTGFAGIMRRYGFDDDAVASVLMGLNNQLTEHPLPPEEVMAIVASSSRWDQDVFPDEIDVALEAGELDGDILLAGDPALNPAPTAELPSFLVSSRSLELPPPAEWYWNPYLPEGRLVLLDGAEGIGKGMFCAYIATEITTGTWGDPANVLWMSTEDDPQEDILKRLYAAGWYPDAAGDVIHFTKWLHFPKQTDVLEQTIEKTGTRFVVMDPGRSFIKREDGQPMSYNDEAAIRPAMEELNRMAKRTGAAVLFVHHWNKDSQGSTRTRAGGTGAFAQVVRHRLSMAAVGQGDTREWAFEVHKSNITSTGHLRGFRLVRHAELDTARFELLDPIGGGVDLGTWMKERSKAVEGGEIALNPAGQLEAWMRQNFVAGDALPDRDEIVEQSGLSFGKVKTAISALRGRGALEHHGRRLIVTQALFENEQ